MIRTILTWVFLIAFTFGLAWIAILDEVYYYRTTQYAEYTIRIELLNGSIDTIKTRQPVGIHLQINCHSHKGNFRGCDLEMLPNQKELHNFLDGHWRDVRDGVINFRVLKIVNE